jgi:hypothetical protein
MNDKAIVYYKDYCRTVDCQKFIEVKNKVLSYIVEPATSTTAVLLFSDWLFNKINNIWKAPKDVREEVFAPIKNAIENTQNVVSKMDYINWRDVEYSLKLCTHFYKYRFNESFFIQQMLNDSNLLKWKQNFFTQEELLLNFLNWLSEVSTYEQKSNLLDILLRYFPKDERVKTVYSTLMGGKTLYENDQNVHDDDITVSVLNVLRELYVWSKKSQPVYSAKNGLTRSEWVEKILYSYSSEPTIIKGILDRMAIDKTSFNITEDIHLTTFDVLFMLLNYILQCQSATAIMETLIEEMKEAVDFCITGYVTRFINAIQGYTDDFQLKISFKKQLHAKINYDISKEIQRLPNDSDVILGTYDEEHKDIYYKFIIDTIDLNKLYEQYDKMDVIRYLPPVLNTLTEEQIWEIDEKGLHYKRKND